MIDAVLFDWGDTLMHYDVSDELAEARTRAGLAALRREGLPEPAAIGGWWRDRASEFFPPGAEEESDWIAVLGACFAELGCKLSDDDVRLYARESLFEVELAVTPAMLELLDALRERSLALAIVSNTALPLWLLEPAFERQGLAERMDAIVLSSEVGKRKPHPLIFERALAELGVEAKRALFVGDRLYEDVRGAGNVGMATVQAAWFRVDDNPDGGRPDFRAEAPHDILRIVERVAPSP